MPPTFLSGQQRHGPRPSWLYIGFGCSASSHASFSDCFSSFLAREPGAHCGFLLMPSTSSSDLARAHVLEVEQCTIDAHFSGRSPKAACSASWAGSAKSRLLGGEGVAVLNLCAVHRWRHRLPRDLHHSAFTVTQMRPRAGCSSMPIRLHANQFRPLQCAHRHGRDRGRHRARIQGSPYHIRSHVGGFSLRFLETPPAPRPRHRAPVAFMIERVAYTPCRRSRRRSVGTGGCPQVSFSSVGKAAAARPLACRPVAAFHKRPFTDNTLGRGKMCDVWEKFSLTKLARNEGGIEQARKRPTRGRPSSWEGEGGCALRAVVRLGCPSSCGR